jgi:hypothetical protein
VPSTASPAPATPAPPSKPAEPAATPARPATPSAGGEKGGEKKGEKSGKESGAGSTKESGKEQAKEQGKEQGNATGSAAGADAGKGRAPQAAPAGVPGAGASARTPEEHRDALDGRLQESMAEFDGMLMKEQAALQEKQRANPLPDRSGEGSGGAAGGEGEDGKGGQGGGRDDRTAAEKRADAEAEAAEKQAKSQGKGDDPASADAGAPAASADTATGGSTEAGRLEGGAPVTAPVEGGPAGPGSDSTSVPADVGDGKDDDVVARQLREAALKEKDPAIREKLWDEYREYKKGTGKGGE